MIMLNACYNIKRLKKRKRKRKNYSHGYNDVSK
jgi:hypothetical protein